MVEARAGPNTWAGLNNETFTLWALHNDTLSSSACDRFNYRYFFLNYRYLIHFISFHSSILSFRFFSFLFLSFLFVSFPFLSFPLLSFPFIHFISFHFVSFHFVSFHFVSFHFVSFHFLSFPFIHSFILSFFHSFHFISFHFISFHLIWFHFIHGRAFQASWSIGLRSSVIALRHPGPEHFGPPDDGIVSCSIAAYNGVKTYMCA